MPSRLLVLSQRPRRKDRFRPAPDSGPYGGAGPTSRCWFLPLVGGGIGPSRPLEAGARAQTHRTPAWRCPAADSATQQPAGFAGCISAPACPLLSWRSYRSCAAGGAAASPLLAVGDLLPLLAWLCQRCALRLSVGTPKSDYTWRSGLATTGLPTAITRCKGSEWDPMGMAP